MSTTEQVPPLRRAVVLKLIALCRKLLRRLEHGARWSVAVLRKLAILAGNRRGSAGPVGHPTKVAGELLGRINCSPKGDSAAVGQSPPPGAGSRGRWTGPSDTGVFYRESAGQPGSEVLLHIHGFGLSGRYLLPTAEHLGGTFRNLVPDLPGFGRSHRAADTLDVPELAHAAASFLDDLGIASATLVGNSMGCAVICEFARLYPERLNRAILVAPAGGVNNQPLHRAVRQLARDSVREPVRLAPVAVPDYLHFGVPSTVQLFRALTRYPTLERLLALRVPTLGVMGDRDPLMPGPARLKEIADQEETHLVMVVIEGAAHAINFSHPGELAHVIRSFMADKPIIDDPGSPGVARSYEIHRGIHVLEGS